MIIEVLYFEGCPNHPPTLELARQVLGELGLAGEIREVRVETAEDAARERFLGSPSVRVNGEDIEPEVRERTDFGLSCRIYAGGGVPPKELLVTALSAGASQ
ncbi:MAG: hypothetical protein O7A09_05745 [Proteobacteria bacterium]|nr:hypothetical protein [Pseudomonadota bacterium]MCZ6784048.1 hypothetical protein [Pseudomonadota bacterium]